MVFCVCAELKHILWRIRPFTTLQDSPDCSVAAADAVCRDKIYACDDICIVTITTIDKHILLCESVYQTDFLCSPTNPLFQTIWISFDATLNFQCYYWTVEKKNISTELYLQNYCLFDWIFHSNRGSRII